MQTADFNDETYKTLIQEANQYYKAKELINASTTFLKAAMLLEQRLRTETDPQIKIRLKKEQMHIYAKKAEIYMQRNLNKEALTMYKAAITIAAEITASNDFPHLADSQNYYEQLLKYGKNVLDAEALADIHFAMALINLAYNIPATAKEHLEKACELAPKRTADFAKKYLSRTQELAVSNHQATSSTSSVPVEIEVETVAEAANTPARTRQQAVKKTANRSKATGCFEPLFNFLSPPQCQREQLKTDQENLAEALLFRKL